MGNDGMEDQSDARLAGSSLMKTRDASSARYGKDD